MRDRISCILIAVFVLCLSIVGVANAADGGTVKYSNIKWEFPQNEDVAPQTPKKRSFVGRMMPKATYIRVSKPTVFVPKGQWVLGASIQYSENDLNNIKFLILDKVNLKGYSVKASAFVGYAAFNDGVVGVRASYSRSLIDLDNLDLNLGSDLNFNVSNNYSLSHSMSMGVYMRNYISIFNSLRFGLFNDVQVGFEVGQGKVYSGTGDAMTGTYSETSKFKIGLSPGASVFLTDFTAVELSVGVLGFESTWVRQITNQIEESTLRRSGANFKVDLFSIKLGVTFFLNSKKLLNSNVKKV